MSHSRHLQVWPEPEETRMRAKKFMMDILYKGQKCIKRGRRLLYNRNKVFLMISEMRALG